MMAEQIDEKIELIYKHTDGTIVWKTKIPKCCLVNNVYFQTHNSFIQHSQERTTEKNDAVTLEVRIDGLTEAGCIQFTEYLMYKAGIKTDFDNSKILNMDCSILKLNELMEEDFAEHQFITIDKSNNFVFIRMASYNLTWPSNRPNTSIFGETNSHEKPQFSECNNVIFTWTDHGDVDLTGWNQEKRDKFFKNAVFMYQEYFIFELPHGFYNLNQFREILKTTAKQFTDSVSDDRSFPGSIQVSHIPDTFKSLTRKKFDLEFSFEKGEFVIKPIWKHTGLDASEIIFLDYKVFLFKNKSKASYEKDYILDDCENNRDRFIKRWNSDINYVVPIVYDSKPINPDISGTHLSILWDPRVEKNELYVQINVLYRPISIIYMKKHVPTCEQIKSNANFPTYDLETIGDFAIYSDEMKTIIFQQWINDFIKNQEPWFEKICRLENSLLGNYIYPQYAKDVSGWFGIPDKYKEDCAGCKTLKQLIEYGKQMRKLLANNYEYAKVYTRKL